MSLRKIIAAAALGGGIAMAPAAASAVDFSGKTVTIIVPFKEGGGLQAVTVVPGNRFYNSICQEIQRSLFLTSRVEVQFWGLTISRNKKVMGLHF